jgi:chromate reductase
MLTRSLNVLALPGSLRTGSLNLRFLENAAAVAPAGMNLAVFRDLGSVPLFNQDIEGVDSDPPGVQALRSAIATSDGLIISTPEYNQSVPGVVKNALDWLSRERPMRGLDGLPVAVTGATRGPYGTRAAQSVLKQMLIATGCIVMPRPALFVREAVHLFDDAGTLTDEPMRLRLQDFLAAFDGWIRRVTPDE